MKKLIALISFIFVACGGNESPTNSTPKVKSMPAGFTNDSVRFTSVMPNAGGADESLEWFTVTNFSSQPMDLRQGWFVVDKEKQVGTQIYYKFQKEFNPRDSIRVNNVTNYAFMRNTDDTLYLYKYQDTDTTLVDMIFWKDAKDDQIIYR
ncbi:MAG: hypothetical protein J0M05_10745 [Candidatus Kapabacteria bacterium]|nr:hypothetical protein [Candidatus Kapabacteria bacterium]